MDCATILHNVTDSEEKCRFILDTVACQSTGFIKYTNYVYCDISDRLLWLGLLPCVILLIMLFVGLSTAADSFFCPSLAVIVEHLKLSHNIAGVTFLAFGNGAPDIFSSIASIVNVDNSSAGLAFGALLGAGIFLSTIIVGCVTLMNPFDVMQRPFLRDVIFYMATLYWVFYILYKGRIRLVDSVGFIILYFCYVLVVGIGRFVRKRMQAREQMSNAYKEGTPMDGDSVEVAYDSSEDTFHKYDLFHGIQGHANPIIDFESDADLCSVADSEAELTVKFSSHFGVFNEVWSVIKPFSLHAWRKAKFYQKVILVIRSPVLILLTLTVPVVDLEKPNNNWSKPLTLIHCVSSPVFALFVTKNITYMIGGVLPVAALVFVVGLLFAVLVGFLTTNKEIPRLHKFMSYVGFLVAVLWIYSLAREVVNLLTMFGMVLNASQEILGLTVLAWSNSLGDLISDLTVASQGYPRMAISACFGGPLFNLLLGIGIPFTIMTAKNGGEFKIELTPVAEILCVFLAISLISSFIILPVSKFRATRPYAVYLLVLYVTFIVVAVLTELNVIGSIWPVS